MKNILCTILFLLSVNNIVQAEEVECFARCSFTYDDAIGIHPGQELSLIKSKSKNQATCLANLNRKCQKKSEKFMTDFTPDSTSDLKVEEIKSY
jgi:hypothetical protein